jgi:hypothetical protein
MLVPTGSGTQSLSAGQQVQAATNITAPSGAGAQSLNTTQQLQIASNLMIASGAGAQVLSASQALQARSNLLMSTDIGKIEMWPTSFVPAGPSEMQRRVAVAHHLRKFVRGYRFVRLGGIHD